MLYYILHVLIILQKIQDADEGVDAGGEGQF